jgi:cytochrome c oxidase cbb3-type subunit 2
LPNNALTSNPHKGRLFDGWRGIALILATYFYFLIFAQFGFLKRLSELGLGDAHLKAVMAAMAAGGILASLLAPRWLRHLAPSLRLKAAMATCATAAVLTTLPLNLFSCVVIAVLIGTGLGVLTVTLVTDLPAWIGHEYSLFKIALGTGTAYFLCNIPALFTAPDHIIALSAASGMILCFPLTAEKLQATHPPLRPVKACGLPFLLMLLWFTALVWLDSAMFYILQHEPAPQSGAWVGAAHLWRTGCIHLVAALAAAWLLYRRGLPATLLSAFALLAGTALLLHSPQPAGLADWLYPVGISLYSVALVAYPAYLLAALPRDRALRTGWIYAVAGWIGSAMGIGMAQHLHQVPLWFVAATGCLFLLPLLRRLARKFWRMTIALLLTAGASGLLYGAVHLYRAPSLQLTAIERGRQVYIGEGCIHCHSQYVRPGTPDVAMWGPASIPAKVEQEKPPLIGNRRQGPDLSNVGSRRSRLWLRIHLIDPRAVSPHSIMPSYAYLFRSSRGDDLLAYLSSLRSSGSAAFLQRQLQTWHPAPHASRAATALDGSRLYREYCTTCHAPNGYARQHWGRDFPVAPPNLAIAPLPHIQQNLEPKQERLALERIIKYGIPGTNMPGHEYLLDAQVISLAREVIHLRTSHSE